MRLKTWPLIVLLCLSTSIWAQSDEGVEAEEQPKPPKATNSPTIGVGVGILSFFGDVRDNRYGNPFVSNIAYEVYLNQPINSNFDLNFDAIIGKVRVDERSIERNINFESDIRMASMNLEYNFGHFLKEDRNISPYIHVGVEAIEFNTKADLLAADGTPYNYWSDGSIRNVAENSPDAASAVIIKRDYRYETDLREAGFENDNTYPERALAVPLGLGVTMHLNDQFNFRMGSALHISFSDFIDGVTPNTSVERVGTKAGDSRDDWFLMTGFSISYNFQKVPSPDPIKKFDELEDDEVIDYTAYDDTDYDFDGVIDFYDKCPNTPPDVEVDSLGCPLDSDNDGIPDYKDEEIDSPYGFVNEKGVEVTDEMIYKSYLRYIDSSGESAEVIERSFSGRQVRSKPYRVQVGKFPSEPSPEVMEKLLSIPNLGRQAEGDSVVFTAGSFSSLPAAVERKEVLRQQGFADAEILKKNASGQYKPASKKVNELKPTAPVAADKGIVFRVQIGAFKKEPDAKAYRDIPSLFVVESGGYYRYMSGSFSKFEDAAKHKVKMVVDGYKGSFVVAYKNGKRVPLKSVGVNPIPSNPIGQ